MENEDPYHRQAPWPPRSKVKVAMSHGASDRCWPISRERKVLEIPKLVGRLPTLRAILRTCFRVKRSKVKVSRETESVSYLRSEKAYELQNWYADRACYQLPRPAIKVYEVGFLFYNLFHITVIKPPMFLIKKGSLLTIAAGTATVLAVEQNKHSSSKRKTGVGRTRVKPGFRSNAIACVA